MMIRRAAIQDLEQIMQIYARAVQYMQASGNPNQWVAGYPSRTLIEEDIARGVSYVVDRDSVIEAVFSYIEGKDPTYRQIEQGRALVFARKERAGEGQEVSQEAGVQEDTK